MVWSWPIEKLAPNDIMAAEGLLQRRNELANGPALAKQILIQFLEKMDIPLERDYFTKIYPILATIVYRYNENN